MGKILLYYSLIKILFSWTSLAYDDNPELEKIGNLIYDGIDERVDPCDDFYAHVCGAWNDSSDPIDEALDTVIATAQDILVNHEIEPDNEKLLKEKKWYDACMLSTSESHVMKDIVEKSGGLLLPDVNTDSQEDERNWQEVAKFYSKRLGANGLFDIVLNENKIIKIEPLGNIMKGDIKPQHLEAKTKKMFESFKPESMDLESSSLSDVIEELEELVISLHEVVDEVTLNNYKVISIEKFKKIQVWSSGKIDWFELIQAQISDAGIILKDTDEIEVDTAFMRELSKALKNAPNHAIVNYIHYCNTMVKDSFEIWGLKRNEWSPSIKYRFCIKKMPIYEGYTSVILEDYLPEESPHIITKMFKALSQEMNNELLHSWLEGNQLADFVKKLEKMKIFVEKIYGFTNEHVGREISYDFEITTSDMENFINFKKAQSRFLIQKYVSERGSRRDKRELNTSPKYNYEENRIDFMLLYLFQPMFHVDAPIALNYGYIGTVLGHEMSHMFNLLFRNYDRSIEEIKQRKIQCLVQQFDNYGINGTITFEENMADSLGIKLSFNALSKAIYRDETEDVKLPNFKHLTAEKLFFYTFAHSLCETPVGKYDPTHEHAPNQNRVNGALSNLVNFASTFECRRGSPMNPDKKCDLLSSN